MLRFLSIRIPPQEIPRHRDHLTCPCPPVLVGADRRDKKETDARNHGAWTTQHILEVNDVIECTVVYYTRCSGKPNAPAA